LAKSTASASDQLNNNHRHSADPPMLPTAKRAADDAWTQGDRVRTALIAVNSAFEQLGTAIDNMQVDAPIGVPTSMFDELCTQAAAFRDRIGAAQQPAATLALPADCWGVVMEFALDRRTMATFGANGCVNEPREYWPKRDASVTAQLRTLRQVSRTWCRLASSLVRAIMLDNDQYIGVPDSIPLATVFPNARYIGYRLPKYDDSALVLSLVRVLEKNAERRHGCPPAPGYSRIFVNNIKSEQFGVRIVGQNETRFAKVTTIDSLASALSDADIVLSDPGGYRQFNYPTNVSSLSLRARIIVIMSSSDDFDDFLFCLLATADANARENLRIYNCPYFVDCISKKCEELGISYIPAVGWRANPVVDAVAGVLDA